jgi:hypothetical protein
MCTLASPVFIHLVICMYKYYWVQVGGNEDA